MLQDAYVVYHRQGEIFGCCRTLNLALLARVSVLGMHVEEAVTAGDLQKVVEDEKDKAKKAVSDAGTCSLSFVCRRLAGRRAASAATRPQKSRVLGDIDTCMRANMLSLGVYILAMFEKFSNSYRPRHTQGA